LTLSILHMDTTIDIAQKYTPMIHSRIMDDKTGFRLLKILLHQSKPDKELLTLSKCESAEFVPDEKKIIPQGSLHFERLVMMNPPSFEFSLILSLTGYFNVKYTAIKDPLPMRVDPFRVKYSGILIDRDGQPEITNESLKVIKN